MTQHHDPVHPDSPHLSPELVADLDEGLLDDQSAAHAEHHLAQCARCAALRDALGDVSRTLASLPPAAMPAERVAVLEAAMQGWRTLEEAPLPTAAAPVASDTPRETPSDTVVPIGSARSRREGWSTRLVTAAASVAGVLLITAVGFSMVSGSSGDGGTGTGAVEAADADDQGGDDLQAFVAGRSGQAYNERTMDDQVDTLLVASQVEDEPSPVVTTSPDPTATPMVTATVKGSPTAFGARITDPAALQACITDYLLFPDARPLAVDVGTFGGQPAAVIVMPRPEDSRQVAVYVVDPDCSGPDATLLYFAVVDLP